jgi:hypothetical protein
MLGWTVSDRSVTRRMRQKRLASAASANRASSLPGADSVQKSIALARSRASSRLTVRAESALAALSTVGPGFEENRKHAGVL